jgi:TrmH family RNA methyltransferase
VITSAHNPRLRLVRRLHGRRQRERLGLFSCEGEDLVEAALAAGLAPVEALVDAERPPELPGLADAEPVEPRLLADVSALGHPPRVLAIFRKADLPRLEPGAAPEVGLALWHVGDPGNVGTLLRAADGLGPAFVALSDGCADPTGSKALRASAGAVFRVPVGAFAEAPGPKLALISRGGAALGESELGERVTFVLGAEREGLPGDVVASCDGAVTVPLAARAESLNVAMTGTIALYEWRRRRR